MYNKYTISGNTTKEFEEVQNAFENNFKYGVEIASQLCIYYNQECVVNLSGVINDNITPGGKKIQDTLDIMKMTEGYNSNSIQQIFSSGKNLTALCLCICIEKKLINYDNLVSEYWPEFAKNGKDKITIAHIMKHESGLSNFIEFVNKKTMEDQVPGGLMSKLIENSPSKWWYLPNTPIINSSKTEFRRSYHAITQGLIINQIIQRVDPLNRNIGQFLRDEVAIPLGLENSLFIGIPLDIQESNKIHIAPIVSSASPNSIGEKFMKGLGLPISDNEKIPWDLIDPENDLYIKGYNIWDKYNNAEIALTKMITCDTGNLNSKWLRKIQSPSSTSHTNAQSLAIIASMLANKGTFKNIKIINEETFENAHSNNTIQFDDILLNETNFTQGGFGIFSTNNIELLNSNSYCNIFSGCDIYKFKNEIFYGWGGVGGSIFLWNNNLNIGISYTMTGMSPYISSGPRIKRILSALFKSLNNIIK